MENEKIMLFSKNDDFHLISVGIEYTDYILQTTLFMNK